MRSNRQVGRQTGREVTRVVFCWLTMTLMLSLPLLLVLLLLLQRMWRWLVVVVFLVMSTCAVLPCPYFLSPPSLSDLSLSSASCTLFCGKTFFSFFALCVFHGQRKECCAPTALLCFSWAQNSLHFVLGRLLSTLHDSSPVLGMKFTDRGKECLHLLLCSTHPLQPPKGTDNIANK